MFKMKFWPFFLSRFPVRTTMTPSAVRWVSMGLAVVLFWLLSFALAQGLDPLLNALTPQGLFSALAASCALVVGFVVACVPETKGELPLPVSPIK